MDQDPLALGLSTNLSLRRNSSSTIWVFWYNDLNCSVQHDSGQSLTLLCHHTALNLYFLFTAVYAKCTRSERIHLWDHLRTISDTSLPWLIGGDFKIISTLDERLGGNAPLLSAMYDFNSCISDCSLSKCSPAGSKYTWKKPKQRLWQTLDRFLRNVAWNSSLMISSITHLHRLLYSDHCPLLGCFAVALPSPASFSFQNMWTLHDLPTVIASWNSVIDGEPMRVFSEKLKR